MYVMCVYGVCALCGMYVVCMWCVCVCVCVYVYVFYVLCVVWCVWCVVCVDMICRVVYAVACRCKWTTFGVVYGVV